MRNKRLREASADERRLAEETFVQIAHELDPSKGWTLETKRVCTDYIATLLVIAYERGRISNIAKSRRRPLILKALRLCRHTA